MLSIQAATLLGHPATASDTLWPHLAPVPPLAITVPAQGLPALPGYDILAQIGQGGMGVVYKAYSLEMNRVVAIKMLAPGIASADRLQRFRTEAETISRLSHPGIVGFHALDEWNNVPFLVLEFCAGGTLATHLAERPLPAREAAALVLQLAQAVSHVHAAGIVHRDLKPANVLLTGPDLRTRLADFGLARLPGDLAPWNSNRLIGTPAYMAAEQVTGQHALGFGVDCHALGCILYECLTGRSPYLGTTVAQTLDFVLNRQPPPVNALVPAVPRELERMALDCMHEDPGQRCSAADLARRLEQFLRAERAGKKRAGSAVTR